MVAWGVGEWVLWLVVFVCLGGWAVRGLCWLMWLSGVGGGEVCVCVVLCVLVWVCGGVCSRKGFVGVVGDLVVGVHPL